jgi:hypothetical protein
MSVPSFIASFDSASAMSQATAQALRGDDFDALGQPKVMKPAAKGVRWLPRKLREGIFIASGATETISPRRVHRVDFEEIGEWLSEEYPPGPYPAVAVGSSNGALTHLYAALGIPWLPQTTLVPVRQRVHPDDPTGALERGRKYGRRMMEAHPDLQLHHMHDANQDRMMVRALTYFRVKRRRLGPDYERFLTERLQPGGTILVVECRSTWRTTQVADRYYFQHGAMGGIDQEEYHHGSERVAEYLDRYDSPTRSWHGPEPDTVSPEAEWGFEPALADDIQRFADAHGYRVARLVFDEPEDMSPLVADLYRWWYARRRIPANRLIVSSFVLMEPLWTLRTGSVPFWMKFNTEPSLERLDRYLEQAPPYDEIYLMLFQHGVEAAGLPPKEDWQNVLDHARKTGRTLGLTLDDFPLDFPHFARYHEEIREQIPSRYPTAPLPLADLDRFLTERAGDYGVTWTGDFR